MAMWQRCWDLRTGVGWVISLLAAMVLAGPGLSGQTARAEDEGGEIPFDVAEIFFELNHTDGDLGIHGKIDGGPWSRVKIEDPYGRPLLAIRTISRLRRQGMTEFAFESAEPTFDELDPEDFFRRFPQGIYEVEGRSQDREELESETLVTHRMPAPPAPTVNGEPLAEVCHEDDPDHDAPGVSTPVTISWPPVTTSHPDLGSPRNGDIVVHNYEVVVEIDAEVDGEEFTSVFSVVLPPGVTSMTIPMEFLAQAESGDQVKYEVLVREESFNQTAVESCFVLK